MADRAVVVVLPLLVVRVLDAVIVRHMARIAVGRCRIVPAISVARSTSHVHMRTLKAERELVVINVRRAPGVHRVTSRAVVVVVSLLVVWILDTVEVRHMARITVCRRSVVSAIDMA